MLYFLLLAGFGYIAWKLHSIERHLNVIGLQVIKGRWRLVYADRRHSKRLYELGRILRDIQSETGDISNSTIALSADPENGFSVKELRTVNFRRRRKRFRSTAFDADEVLPSDVNPADEVKWVDWSEVEGLSLDDAYPDAAKP